MSICCMFAGQGAQTPGMGKDFAEADNEVMAMFDKANSVLGFDLKKICFEGPAEELTKSNICQPAIFVTSYAAYTMLQKRHHIDFSCAAGLSLGEWGALCAAGVLDFDSTLTVLEARGRFMQEACEATPSGMIAIVGASPEQLKTLCEKSGCTVANINSAAQQVLSGSKDAVAAAATIAKELGIKRAIPLATAGAFHSPFMAPAREKLASVLENLACIGRGLATCPPVPPVFVIVQRQYLSVIPIPLKASEPSFTLILPLNVLAPPLKVYSPAPFFSSVPATLSATFSVAAASAAFSTSVAPLSTVTFAEP